MAEASTLEPCPFTWILDDLAVGGTIPSGVAGGLARSGVGAVINVTTDGSEAEEFVACGSPRSQSPVVAVSVPPAFLVHPRSVSKSSKKTAFEGGALTAKTRSS